MLLRSKYVGTRAPRCLWLGQTFVVSAILRGRIRFGRASKEVFVRIWTSWLVPLQDIRHFVFCCGRNCFLGVLCGELLGGRSDFLPGATTPWGC